MFIVYVNLQGSLVPIQCKDIVHDDFISNEFVTLVGVKELREENHPSINIHSFTLKKTEIQYYSKGELFEEHIDIDDEEDSMEEDVEPLVKAGKKRTRKK